MDVEAARMIGAGFAVIALLGVGLGIGNIFSNLINAVARNPEARDQLFPIGILGWKVISCLEIRCVFLVS
jgi:F-type H+-transporting ATPase subunit c